MIIIFLSNFGHADDYLCDLKLQKSAIKWKQLNLNEFIEIPLLSYDIIGYYELEIRKNSQLKISNMKFSEDLYQNNIDFTYTFAEEIFDDFFYNKELSDINRSYANYLIKYMKQENLNFRDLAANNIDLSFLQNVNLNVESLHRALRNISETRKQQAKINLIEMLDEWIKTGFSEYSFNEMISQLDLNVLERGINETLNHPEINQYKKVTKNNILFSFRDASFGAIKISINSLDNSNKDILMDFRTDSWINDFMFEISFESYCNNSNKNLLSSNIENSSLLKDRLRKLKDLFDEGLISQDQYDEKSSEILNDF